MTSTTWRLDRFLAVGAANQLELHDINMKLTPEIERGQEFFYPPDRLPLHSQCLPDRCVGFTLELAATHWLHADPMEKIRVFEGQTFRVDGWMRNHDDTQAQTWPWIRSYFINCRIRDGEIHAYQGQPVPVETDDGTRVQVEIGGFHFTTRAPA